MLLEQRSGLCSRDATLALNVVTMLAVLTSHHLLLTSHTVPSLRMACIHASIHQCTGFGGSTSRPSKNSGVWVGCWRGFGRQAPPGGKAGGRIRVGCPREQRWRGQGGAGGWGGGGLPVECIRVRLGSRTSCIYKERGVLRSLCLSAGVSQQVCACHSAQCHSRLSHTAQLTCTAYARHACVLSNMCNFMHTGRPGKRLVP